jgi:hypothetical protein
VRSVSLDGAQHAHAGADVIFRERAFKIRIRVIHQIFGMETLAFRPGRKCRSLQWLLGKDKTATCRVSLLCGGILSRYGFKAAHLNLVRATASRLQTGMVRRVSGHTLSTVRGIERRIWESPSFMAWEDVKAALYAAAARAAGESSDYADL